MSTAPKPKPKPVIKVNLLYPQGLPQKLPTVFVKWLLSYGRYILIVVEILVLTTFGMRFFYDAKISDNNDAIDQLTQPITARLNDEAAFRQTAQKLQFIRTNINQGNSYAAALAQLAAATPTGIRFNSLNIDSGQTQLPTFRITGNSSSNAELNLFVEKLRAENQFQNVSLVSLGLDKDQITFAITGEVKELAQRK